MVAPQDKLTDDWASPQHFHRYAHRHVTKFRAETQSEQSREWTVFLKEEPRSGNDTSTKNAKDEEARTVLPVRLSYSTEHDQAGVHRDPIHRRPDREPSDGREFPTALADVNSDHIHSHPNTEFCGGACSRPLSSLGT